MNARTWPQRWQALLAEARSVRRRQPEPSGPIAVLEDETGGLHAGIGLAGGHPSASGILGEQVAAARLRLSGATEIRRVLLLHGPGTPPAPPTGGALQILHE
ncbi:MAG: hypothetical protein GF346_11725, partial [Candidatus Eisenbacteria bacterium]|nr:hypothetical protein [Candidatus Latescibacterota bacterium]MBD3303105.1 hypothetical protein [Candidatus Eisenbacteria bacterium]